MAAQLLDQTLEQRFDLLKAEIKAFTQTLSGAPEESLEDMREDVHATQNVLEDAYSRILVDAGGQAAVNASETLRKKRIQTRNALRHMRMLLQARWGYEYITDCP